MSPCAEAPFYPSLRAGGPLGCLHLPAGMSGTEVTSYTHPMCTPASFCWHPFLGVESRRGTALSTGGTARLSSLHSHQQCVEVQSHICAEPAITRPLLRAILTGVRWHGPGFDLHCLVVRTLNILKYTSLVTCLPKHFAVFDDIASRIFLISFLVCSLLQNRNTIDFAC